MNYEKLTKAELIVELDKLNQEIEELKKDPNPESLEFLKNENSRLSQENTVIIQDRDSIKIDLDNLKSLSDQYVEQKRELQEKYDSLSNAPVIAPIPTVVFPYVARFAQGNELLHAIRGWSENFKEDFKVVVVGDKEDWFGENILHIPHECNTKNPPLDIVEKMKLVMECEDVPEEFIWTNDDIYPVNAVSLIDLKLLKCDGNLAKGYPHSGGIYATNKNRTYDLLKSRRRPTYDYGTHTPMVFEKEKLEYLIEKYKIDEEAYLVSCLYFNFFFQDMIPFQLDIATDNIKCGVYRPNPNMKVVESALTSKKFINNSQSGYVKPLVELLEKRFSTPCRFECETEEQE